MKIMQQFVLHLLLLLLPLKLHAAPQPNIFEEVNPFDEVKDAQNQDHHAPDHAPADISIEVHFPEIVLKDAHASAHAPAHAPAHGSANAHAPAHNAANAQAPAHDAANAHVPAHASANAHAPAHASANSHASANAHASANSHAPAHASANAHAPAHASANAHAPAHASANAHAPAHALADSNVPANTTARAPDGFGPEYNYRSRCWKAGFSPRDGHPVDHTRTPFLAAPSCRGKVYLVSIVHSAADNRPKRDLIRSTWGSAINVEGRRLATVFVVGRSANDEVNQLLDEESQKFSDLIIVNFLDSYRNLTYKHLYGIRWALKYCRDARFVLKVDDDVLVNIFQLVSYITDRFSQSRNFFYCRTTRGKKVTDTKMKFYVTPEEWPVPEYPAHCHGLGYLVSAELLPALHLCAKWRRYFWIDNIFVTGAVAEAVGATLLHWSPGWDFQFLHPKYTGPGVNEAILYNEFDSQPMPALTRRAWRAMLAYST